MDKILIFRPDNIGDVVLFSGALKHIRKKFPEAHITLAVLEHIVNFVELCPYINSCISLKELNWWYRIERKHIPFSVYFREIVRKLDRFRNAFIKPYDLIIYPVKSPLPNHLEMVHDLSIDKTYGIAGCLVNAPQSGYPAKIDPKRLFSDYLDVAKEDPWRHELFTTLDFLKFLGCDVSDIADIKPEIWVSDSDKSLLDNEQTNGRKVIGLFPGASFEGRCWDPANYETFAKLMHEDLTYVILGGAEDQRLAQHVESFLKTGRRAIKVINLIGKTTIRELYKTISACNLFIGMETSGLHLALTTGIPTIGIVGGGHYGRFVPWGEPGRNLFLTRNMECFNCKWNCINRFDCIKNVSPEEVAKNANRLLYA